MEDDLRRLMVEFCERFKLKYYVRYSHSLTQKEITAWNMLGSGELKDLLNKHGDDYSKIDKEVNKSLKAMSGTGNVEADGVIKLRNILTNADKNDKIANYLKHNEELFILLTNCYNKTVNENLVDTIPIPISKGFKSFYFNITGQKLALMIHESIHYILSKNGIDFSGGMEGLSPLDEGFCVFMHFRFNKHTGLYKHDRSSLSVQYRRWAGFFGEVFKNTPDSEIIPTIRKIKDTYGIAGLKKLLNQYDVINEFKELQEKFQKDLTALKNTCDKIQHDINETFVLKNKQ